GMIGRAGAAQSELQTSYFELLTFGVGVPTGIRTRVPALKGPRPRPLDDGDARGDPINDIRCSRQRRTSQITRTSQLTGLPSSAGLPIPPGLLSPPGLPISPTPQRSFSALKEVLFDPSPCIFPVPPLREPELIGLADDHVATRLPAARNRPRLHRF